MDIFQDSLSWGQGQCVPCSNLRCVSARNAASPAVLVSSNYGLPLPLNRGVWGFIVGSLLLLPDLRPSTPHRVAETGQCDVSPASCSLLSSIVTDFDSWSDP